jgi:hypothetical protein
MQCLHTYDFNTDWFTLWRDIWVFLHEHVINHFGLHMAPVKHLFPSHPISLAFFCQIGPCPASAPTRACAISCKIVLWILASSWDVRCLLRVISFFIQLHWPAVIFALFIFNPQSLSPCTSIRWRAKVFVWVSIFRFGYGCRVEKKRMTQEWPCTSIYMIHIMHRMTIWWAQCDRHANAILLQILRSHINHRNVIM